MWIYNQTDELYHFGIPGMKWGVRRNKTISSEKRIKVSKNKNNRSSSKKKKTINKKKLVAVGAVAATTVLALYGTNKILDMKEKASIAKRYPIEKINGLGLDADYAKYYMENFKRIHGGG
jgi:hypothetical protein